MFDEVYEISRVCCSLHAISLARCRKGNKPIRSLLTADMYNIGRMYCNVDVFERYRCLDVQSFFGVLDC